MSQLNAQIQRDFRIPIDGSASSRSIASGNPAFWLPQLSESLRSLQVPADNESHHLVAIRPLSIAAQTFLQSSQSPQISSANKSKNASLSLHESSAVVTLAVIDKDAQESSAFGVGIFSVTQQKENGMTNYSARAFAFAALLATTSLFAADAIKLEGIKCPVSGGAAKDVEGSHVAWKKGQVYFCCANCPKAFDKDKAKYTNKANQQLLATKQVKEVKCPLTGNKLNPDTEIDVQGTKVSFCCNNCKGKVSAAKDAEQLELVFNDKNFEKGFEAVETKK